MELGSAFAEGVARSFCRTVQLIREQEILITDRVLCPGFRPVLNLITAEPPLFEHSENEAAGRLVIGKLAVCQITGSILGAEIQRLPITDPRLKQSWKADLWRTRIAFKAEKELTLRIR